MELNERLRNLVEHMVLEIIDEGHPVSVNYVEGEESLLFEVTVNQPDVGLVIGKQGVNITSIRSIVKAACRGFSVRTDVEVMNSRR